jgi:glycosyltransferase involved in cell wall biosynthesis
LARLGLTAGQYVLFLGRFSPEKNCDMLIEAFEQTNTSMKLVLAGGSSHTDEYVAKLRSHENDKIRLLNWISGDVLAEVLTNAALFVLPSDMEGLSLALLDAMGAGICVLASDTPENREVIGDAGFTFRRGDAKHLQQMIKALVADPDVRAAVGKRAQRSIQQEYLWDDVTQQLEQIYRELTAPESARTSEATRAAASGKAA